MLIAYTFDRYLDTGEEPDWPLLLPMVKSACWAMDAVQSSLARRTVGTCACALHCDRCIEARLDLMAYRSRWTRVAGVVPMVIDILNMRAQIQLQQQTFGSLSGPIHDYEQIHFPERIDSPVVGSWCRWSTPTAIATG